MYSLKNISAFNYFEFTKYCNVYFGNNAQFEQGLIKNLLTLQEFINAEKPKDELNAYIESVTITELVQLKGESLLQKAFKHLEPEKEFNYSEAVESCKCADELLSEEIELNFTHLFNNSIIPTFTEIRNKTIKLAEAMQKGKESIKEVQDEIENIRSFVFKNSHIININPNNKNNYIDNYDRKISRWAIVLGYTEQDLKNISAYYFFTKDTLEHEKNSKNK
jgi:hypothetical protein